MATTVEVLVRVEGAPAPQVDLCLDLESGQRIYGTTEADGVARFSNLPEGNQRLVVTIVPIGLSCWRTAQPFQRGRVTVDCPPIKEVGPIGWWHRAIGISTVDLERGRGLRIGIADRNFVPGEGLERLSVETLAGFGKASPEALSHGELVARLIGGRSGRKGFFIGVAPGVEMLLVPLRPDAGGNGVMLRDLSPALFRLVLAGVDIINLSLGSNQDLPELRNIVVRARRSGVLCVVAAGNEGRTPVSFPARYAACVSVGAIGAFGIGPPGSLVSYQEALRHHPPGRELGGSFYVPQASNYGDKLDITAPGVGIVLSTPNFAPFEMSGTSFAAPIATGALAAALYDDRSFHRKERGEIRCDYMLGRMREMAQDLRMPAAFQGCGLVHL